MNGSLLQCQQCQEFYPPESGGCTFRFCSACAQIGRVEGKEGECKQSDSGAPPARALQHPDPRSQHAPALRTTESVAVPAKQLGFNCPSCFTILIIKDPASYDGRAAPCPYCSKVIIPPKVAPESPFTLITHGRPLHLATQPVLPRRPVSAPVPALRPAAVDQGGGHRMRKFKSSPAESRASHDGESGHGQSLAS